MWHLTSSSLSFVIFIRKVDGAGTIQTPATKLAAFIVLVVFFIFIVLIQLVLLLFVKPRK
ncbi:DUF3923 family protein [Levilactobacillus brevis]|uniref:DUF3923 family protein n=1 Tax=Lactobacillaceae TaxID=33958 RepID=UPI0009E89D93|nr:MULTISPECIES: DUF3923 family protein [Lactobacillaceae]MBT1150911.1 DUF3923 family protein [Lactiplantibacillus argentoratensis]MCT4487570.1 DUF3923 family protein [Levilactobacillus parabrevis]MCT4491362.1 DUF3923 family protein [Levilactobacillus parabrevis]PJE48301.1 DUF3923 domain-containing protein [Pediococcus damnosus]